MIFALVYTVVMIIAVVTVTRMVMALVMALVTKTTRPLLHLWHTRLKYMVFFIVLLVLVHLYLYAIDRYHPEMLCDDYDVALEVDEKEMIGKWIMPRPMYDRLYANQANAHMEGWKESELILKQDHTFTFTPVILHMINFYIPEPAPISAEERYRILDDFRTRKNNVLFGQWELDYSESGQGIDHATIKQELIHSPNKYGVYLKLNIENPEHQENLQCIYLGRIFHSGKKPGSVDQYVIGRTLYLTDYFGERRCYYRRISKNVE